MTITCPHCGYSRETDPARLPPDGTLATCPHCRERFPLRRPETAAPPATAPPAAPAAAAVPPTPTEAATATLLPKGGFWIRLVAAVVDGLLVTTVQVVLGFLLTSVTAPMRSGLSPRGELLVALVLWLFGSIVSMAYYVCFTGYCGQTPGKMAVRVKVICTDGAEITYGRAFLRETLGKFLSALILGIGYLMIAFDGQKQGLHDKIADTYVIKV